MKKEKGITLIALILIVVLIGVVVFFAIRYAQNYVGNQKEVDRKSEMLSIQTVITNIKNKHIVNETENPLIGLKLELENNTTGYTITEEFKQILMAQEGANLYILSKEDLQNSGINNIEINETEFYVVDYNSVEVFYSLGIGGKYKLSEL